MKPNIAETIIAVCGIIIALAALAISIIVYFDSKNTLKKSNKPFLQMKYVSKYKEEYKDRKIKEGEVPFKIYAFNLANEGIGAAYLKGFKIIVDDKQIWKWRLGDRRRTLDGWNLLLKELCKCDMEFKFYSGKLPFVLQPNSSEATIFIGGNDETLSILTHQNNINRYDVQGCYCSIFDDCFTFDDKNPPVNIESCEHF